jgi:hypothetical protein
MKATEILDILNELCPPVPSEFSDDEGHAWGGKFHDALSERLGQKVFFESGVSKFVIIPANENYVLKIPFKGHYEEVWVENEDYDKKYGDEGYCYDEAGHYEYDFIEFSGATNEDGIEPYDHEWNYCNSEVYFYEQAIENGVELYFAAEELLGFLDETPVYKQERAIPFSSTANPYANFTEAHPEEAKNIDKMLEAHSISFGSAFPYQWIYDFIQRYGEDEFFRFYNFCDEYGLLGDMHYGNFGYIEGDIPILIDYSTYEG